MEIRRLGPDDALVYRALRLRGLAEHPDAFTSSYEDEVLRPIDDTLRRLDPDGDDAVYGAFVDGVLAGAAGLGRERRPKNRHKATVFGMYVAPEYGRRGVGADLVRHLIVVARHEAGVEQLVLTVTETNAAARGLYERLGFRAFGVEPRAIRIGDTYFGKTHMILFLDRP
ncbi:MAG: GNAT family N-acetyltransferase [Aromatoleum sp.]|nr:GNAT family N-acetyltransferase [Aromatoleum sp.]